MRMSELLSTEAEQAVWADAELERLTEEGHQAAISLTRKQLRVFLSEADITLAIAGIRGGKTHVGALKCIINAMTHPCSEDECHLVCSPTYQMSRVPVEKVFKLLYDKAIFPICPLIRYVRSERTFILAAQDGGVTRIKVVSMHDPDKIRGIKALSAWIDEGAYIASYAWEVIQGRLADSNGPCWITTTPSGFNWVYELYEEARRGDKRIRVVHWESTENTYIKREGIIRLADRFDSKTHAQEVGARFIRGRGLVYHSFTRAKHNRRWVIDPKRELWIGQDFNVDPMASVFAQPFTTPDGAEGSHVFFSRKEPNSDTPALARFVDAFISQHRIPKANVTFFPDAAGGARSTSGKSDFRILRDAKYTVSAPPRNPMVKDRVNCVNGLLAPMYSKHPRLFVDCAGAPELADSLEKQIWAPDSDPPAPDKTQGFDHLNDALGYKCWRKFPLRQSNSTGRKAA